MEFKHIKLLNRAVSSTLILVTGWMYKLVQISNKRTCKVWEICIILWTTGAMCNSVQTCFCRQIAVGLITLTYCIAACSVADVPALTVPVEQTQNNTIRYVTKSLFFFVAQPSIFCLNITVHCQGERNIFIPTVMSFQTCSWLFSL